MKKGVIVFILLGVIVFVSFSLVSANMFTDFFNKIFGNDVDLSPNNQDGSDSSLNQINCIEIYDPVCGTNNLTYSNSCYAEKANVAIQCEQACPCPISEPIKKCSDGTLYNQCSITKPLYCKEGRLINKCFLCGCSDDKLCQDDGSCKIKENQEELIGVIPEEDRKRIEKDVREMAGIVDAEMPVILDFESVRVVSEGKFELDVVNLFNKKRPLVYKLEEGKYIIDLATTLNQSIKDFKEPKD